MPHPESTDVPKDSKTSIKAYVAGWGNINNQKIKCDTDKHGPAPFQRCNFPFVHRGKVHKRCEKRKKTPSHYDYVCKDFFRKSELNGLELGGREKSYYVYFWNKKLERMDYRYCYNEDTGPYGWCGTCYEFKANDDYNGTEGWCNIKDEDGGEPDVG